MPHLISPSLPLVRRAWLALGLLSALACTALPASTTQAQAAVRLPECFGPGAAGSAAAFLGTTVRLTSECEYSLSRSTGFRSLGLNREVAFLAVLGQLGWRSPQLPVLYGRPRAAAGSDAPATPARGGGASVPVTPASSLILAHCTDFVLEAQGAFAVQPDPNARRLAVRRASNECGAPAMDLEFTCGSGSASQAMPRTQSSITLPECEGPWRVVHKLNECGSAVGQLYRQGLGEFFLDDLWRYEAVWAVPTPEVQQRLLPVLEDGARVRALQHAPYSMVSYAWGRKYQQSNQWALETLALAMEPDSVRTRDQAQAWLQFKGYQPSVLKIGALTRLGGRMGSANIAFDDHPSEQRFADRIETVTVDSVLAWLPRAQLASKPVVFSVKY